MFIVSGIAPDADYASFLFGPSAFLRIHRTALHSLLGGVLVALGIAAIFCAVDRELHIQQNANHPAAPLNFKDAASVCCLGVLSHFMLDFFSGQGIQLFWPLYTHWFGLDLIANLDPWIFAVLIFGTLLPLLFKLINEEIGAHSKKKASRGWPIATLVIFALYLAGRAGLRGNAVNLLVSHQYHRREPNSAVALPYSNTPFTWFGVVRTDNTIETVDVPVSRDSELDSTQSLSYYFNDESAALKAAEAAPPAIRFAKYARAPFAQINETVGGYHFEMRDLSYARDDISPSNIVLLMQLDENLNVTAQAFRFASSEGR